MDDEFLLSLTHERVSRLNVHSPKRLKDLSITAAAWLMIRLAVNTQSTSPIRNLLDALRKAPKFGGIGSYFLSIRKKEGPILTNFDKQLLLEEIEKIATSTCRFGSVNDKAHVMIVETFVNDLTKEFDSRWLSPFRPPHLLNSEKYCIKQILEIINRSGPNINTLTIGDLLNSKYFEYEVDRKLMGCIGKMRLLCNLNLNDSYVDFSQLLSLCGKLYSLRCVSANIIGISGEINVEELQTQLSRLKEFRFKAFAGRKHVVVTGEVCNFLANLLLQHVSNLEVIGDKATEENGSLYFDLRDGVKGWHKKLKHLLVRPTAAFEFQHFKNFPEVTHIKIDWLRFPADKDDFVFPYFPKLSHATILHLPRSMQILDKILMSNGETLRTLCLFQDYRNIIKVKYSIILKSCPNLETLHLRGGMIITDSFEPINFFAILKEIKLSCIRPEIFLSNILSAPHLEDVKIFNVIFVPEDLEYLTALVTQQKVLRKLKSLEITEFPIKGSDCHSELSSLVKHVSAFAPELISLKFTSL
ncbi:Hypothetical predicted protein [Cloeon dipterum]|uniref:Uncharacterized protein n=1 Tax=Cloeon dipterum TaxID=197152 RepID=A0A8S1CVP1_9INSE|nr:Hypothetical predicted protein [Cloeon dipterum]